MAGCRAAQSERDRFARSVPVLVQNLDLFMHTLECAQPFLARLTSTSVLSRRAAGCVPVLALVSSAMRHELMSTKISYLTHVESSGRTRLAAPQTCVLASILAFSAAE